MGDAKILRFLIIHPQKSSKYEVRMRLRFLRFLRNPRKTSKNLLKKTEKYHETCLKIGGFLKILKNFHLRLTLKNQVEDEGSISEAEGESFEVF